MPNPPISWGELHDVPAPGSSIASPWAQDVTHRIAHRFATTTDRDTNYPAGGAGGGAVCYVAATAAMYMSDGSIWHQLARQAAADTITAATRRMGCEVGGAAGSTGPGNFVTLSFITVYQDTDGLYSGSTPDKITINAAGIWGVTLNIAFSGGLDGTGNVDLMVNGSLLQSAAGKWKTGSGSVTMIRPLSPGTTIGGRFYTDANSPVVNWSSTTLDCWRLTP
jgi:hypothetical protein